jgi:hypothetical protein
MNRDQYEDIEDDEDEFVEDGDIVQDGESVRVPFQLMDSVQRSVADGWDHANQRPGWRVPASVQDDAATAHAEYVRYLQDGYRTPAVADQGDNITLKSKPRPTSLADSRIAADAARDERDAWMRDAWRGGR